MLDLKLRYFIAVAKHGSFTLASQYLFTSQSNVSKQISELERELEFALFERLNRGVSLTKAGQYLYEKISYMPSFLDQTIQEAKTLARQEEGRVRLGISDELYMSPEILECLAALQKKYPTVDFECDSTSLKNLRLGLSNNTYDMIFSWQHDVEHIQEYSFAPLWQLPFGVMMKKSHLLAQKKSLSVDDLKEKELLVYTKEASAGRYEWLAAWLKSAGFAGRLDEVSSFAAMVLACHAGKMGLCPLAATLPEGCNLVMVPVENLLADFGVISVKYTNNAILKDMIATIESKHLL